MLRIFSKARLVALAILSIVIGYTCNTAVAQSNMVTYAGNTGAENFLSTLVLSDSTVLVCGSASNLSWVPSTVPVSEISIPALPSDVNPAINGMNSFDTTAIAFIMHLSKDMTTILSVAHLPLGSASDISRMRLSSAPYNPSGNLFISGRRGAVVNKAGSGLSTNAGGWYLARLDNNFLTGTPTTCIYERDIQARERSTGRNAPGISKDNEESDHRKLQPWDVGSDNKVVYAYGEEFSQSWAEIKRLTPLGTQDTVGYFTNQYPVLNGGAQYPSLTGKALQIVNKPLNKFGDKIYTKVGTTSGGLDIMDSVAISGFNPSNIILKIIRFGNQRSYTVADYNATQTDENGNAGRKGKYPNDYFFTLACDSNACNNTTPGYTGYAYDPQGNNCTTMRCGGITIDKRNNDVYYGISVWSKSDSSNKPDFEPYIVALRGNGQQKWWARLYKEDVTRANASQFVDGLEVDYTNNQLVVLGRTIGKSSGRNFWEGNTLTANSGGNGFLNRISGTVTTDVTTMWLGKYALATNQILASTYIAEISPSAAQILASPLSLLDGFATPNAIPATNLANTTITSLSVGADGSVIVAGTSEGRTLTTNNAFMKMLKVDTDSKKDSLITTNGFIRVYTSNLSSVKYSSILTGIWDPTTGLGGNNTKIGAAVEGANGNIVVAATHTATAKVADGAQIPTVNIPVYGSAMPQNTSGILASLTLNCNNSLAQVDSIAGPKSNCFNAQGTYKLRPVPGATKYIWVGPSNNWTVTQLNDSAKIASLPTATIADSGAIRVVAINACGASTIAYFKINAPTITPNPANIIFPAKHCVGETKMYIASPVTGALNYKWIIPAGYTAISPAQAGDSAISNSDTLMLQANIGTTTVQPLIVYAKGTCGYSKAKQKSLNIPGTALLIDSIKRPNNATAYQCAGTTRTYSVTGFGGSVYTWTLPGTGWTSSPTTGNNISVTVAVGAVAGNLSVSGDNGCGASPIKTLALPAPPIAPVTPVLGTVNGLIIKNTLPKEPNVTYQWQRNNSNVVGATDTAINTANLPGTYKLIATGLCNLTTSATLTFTSLAGNIYAGLVNVYPNPATDRLFVTVPDVFGQNLNITLTNVLGSKVLTQTVLNNSNEGLPTISLSSLPQGTYFITISDGTHTVVKQLQKQ